MAGKVLLVDDDKDILMVLRFALEDAGYEITSAGNGDEALKKMQSAAGAGAPFPVAVLDIMMPGMDGLELLRALRKEWPDTLAVMLTAHLSTESAIKALNEGAFSYLTKPVNISEIKAVVGNAFDKYNLVAENRRLMEELCRAKKYSESIIKNLVYTVIATDTNGFIRKINRATENLLGYTEEEIVGMPLESIFAQDFKRTSWQELMNEGKVKDFPMTFIGKAGRELQVSFTGTVLKDEEGQVVGFLGTIRK